MNDTQFDTLARDTQARQGRRIALKALGVAAVAAMASTSLATEAKNKKNKRRKQRRSRQEECPPEDCTAEEQQAAAAACQAQVALCEQEVRVICERQSEEGEEEQECLDELLPCCASLGTCNIPAFFACVAPPPVPN